MTTGTYADPKGAAILFKTVAEEWFASKSQLKPKTRAGYRGPRKVHPGQPGRPRAATTPWRTNLCVGLCGVAIRRVCRIASSDGTWHEPRLKVSRSVTAVAHIGLVEGPTKTHQNRTVPLPRFIADALRGQVEGKGGEELVFSRWRLDAARLVRGGGLLKGGGQSCGPVFRTKNGAVTFSSGLPAGHGAFQRGARPSICGC
jgi:hypothetical protein